MVCLLLIWLIVKWFLETGRFNVLFMQDGFMEKYFRNYVIGILVGRSGRMISADTIPSLADDIVSAIVETVTMNKNMEMADSIVSECDNDSYGIENHGDIKCSASR